MKTSEKGRIKKQKKNMRINISYQENLINDGQITLKVDQLRHNGCFVFF